MSGPCRRFSDHRPSGWSVWGEKDAQCMQWRIKACTVCGEVLASESKTSHSYETAIIAGVKIKKCHYCGATA